LRVVIVGVGAVQGEDLVRGNWGHGENSHCT
jgi:hypothetical protein